MQSYIQDSRVPTTALFEDQYGTVETLEYLCPCKILADGLA